GGEGEESQRRDADRELVDLLGGREPERRAEGARLMGRQLLEPIEERAAELEQARERQPGVRLETGRAQHGEAVGPVDGIGEKRALTDPGLAANRQRAAARGARVVEDLVEEPALLVAADELDRSAAWGRGLHAWLRELAAHPFGDELVQALGPV